jgi:hypothetical protein
MEKRGKEKKKKNESRNRSEMEKEQEGNRTLDKGEESCQTQD